MAAPPLHLGRRTRRIAAPANRLRLTAGRLGGRSANRVAWTTRTLADGRWRSTSLVQAPRRWSRWLDHDGARALLLVALPATLVLAWSAVLPTTSPLAPFLALVALIAYLGRPWESAAALLLGFVALGVVVLPNAAGVTGGSGATGAVATLLGGALITVVVGRLKMEAHRERERATAARAAANALTFVEAIAGDATETGHAHDAILTAMVRLVRAHAGALYLEDGSGAFLRVAAYGSDAISVDGIDLVEDDGFLRRVVDERRPILVRDLAADRRRAGTALVQAGIRGALAVPLVAGSGEQEQLLGVAYVGLLVPHRFSAADAARLEALAGRAASVLATARLADRRAHLLDRTRADLRRLQGLVAAMPEAVVLIRSPDGRIAIANAAAKRLFGPLPDDASGDRITDRLTLPDGRPAAPDQLPIASAMAAGEVATGTELIVRQADNQEVPVLASAAPLLAADGGVAAVVGIFQDIRALKTAERLRQEFVSVISHELRSPLTPIRGFAQLVARDLEREGGHATQIGLLRSLSAQVDRLTRVVDDLLDVSSLRSGRLEIERSETDLVALSALVVQGRQPGAPAHRLVVETDLPRLLGRWDAVRLTQVLDNLVENAIKYSPEGGKVTVTLRREAGGAVLTVDDEGPGIPAADRPKVFAAFYRTEDATARRAAGLGLGLYICRELAVAHGGEIALEEAPGGGARFTVRLPLGLDLVVAEPDFAAMSA